MTSDKEDKLLSLHKRIPDKQKQRGRYFWWESDRVINTNLMSTHKAIINTEAEKIIMFTHALDNDGRMTKGAGGSTWPEEEYTRCWDDISGR